HSRASASVHGRSAPLPMYQLPTNVPHGNKAAWSPRGLSRWQNHKETVWAWTETDGLRQGRENSISVTARRWPPVIQKGKSWTTRHGSIPGQYGTRASAKSPPPSTLRQRAKDWRASSIAVPCACRGRSRLNAPGSNTTKVGNGDGCPAVSALPNGGCLQTVLPESRISHEREIVVH